MALLEPLAARFAAALGAAFFLSPLGLPGLRFGLMSKLSASERFTWLFDAGVERVGYAAMHMMPAATMYLLLSCMLDVDGLCTKNACMIPDTDTN